MISGQGNFNINFRFISGGGVGIIINHSEVSSWVVEMFWKR